MSNVIEFPDHSDKGPWFVVAALCLDCLKKWIGTVPQDIRLFELECPDCGARNSFASFVPDEFLSGAADEGH